MIPECMRQTRQAVVIFIIRKPAVDEELLCFDVLSASNTHPGHLYYPVELGTPWRTADWFLSFPGQRNAVHRMPCLLQLHAPFQIICADLRHCHFMFHHCLPSPMLIMSDNNTRGQEDIHLYEGGYIICVRHRPYILNF